MEHPVRDHEKRKGRRRTTGDSGVLTEEREVEVTEKNHYTPLFTTSEEGCSVAVKKGPHETDTDGDTAILSAFGSEERVHIYPDEEGNRPRLTERRRPKGEGDPCKLTLRRSHFTRTL